MTTDFVFNRITGAGLPRGCALSIFRARMACEREKCHPSSCVVQRRLKNRKATVQMTSSRLEALFALTKLTGTPGGAACIATDRSMPELIDISDDGEQEDEDAAVVRKLANQLYCLEIASRDECSKIAMDLMDAGCWSLENLLEFCPSVTTIQELETNLGMNVKLNPTQLGAIVNWMQRQRQTLVHDSDELGCEVR